jgi:hypothetical protein
MESLNENNVEEYQEHYQELSQDYALWTATVPQLYNSEYGTTETARIYLWNGDRYSLEIFNANQITTIMTRTAQYILIRGQELLGNKTEALLSPQVRFIFDNQDSIEELYMRIRNLQIDDHVRDADMFKQLVKSTGTSMILLMVLVGLLYPFYSFRAFRKR